MSTNAIKLLNIKWIQENTTNDQMHNDRLKWLTRRHMLRHIAAKIIGAGC